MNRNRMGCRALIVLMLVASLVASRTEPAGAVPLMTISGTVNDRIGRPLVGVAVTDGAQTVFTDSQGDYRLEEESVSSVFVGASKTGFEPDGRLVRLSDTLGSVDFVLAHRVTASIAPAHFNSSSAETLTITAKSYAPSAASCVRWTDGLSGAAVELGLSEGIPGGQSTWQGTFVVPAGAADGSVLTTTTVRDCGSTTALSNPTNTAYVVDNIRPTITEILPSSESNTHFASQPLIATIADGGSGVDAATIEFTLSDLTAQTATTISLAKFTNGIAESMPASLALGHRYGVRVTAADRAGNVTVNDQGSDPLQGWERITATVGSAAVGLASEVLGTVNNTLNADGTYTATFPGVTLQAGAVDVELSGTTHAGSGSVRFDVPLTSVTHVCGVLAGVERCEAVNPGNDSNWNVRTVTKRFTASTLGAQTAIAPVTETSVGTLTARVLPTWQSVTLRSIPRAIPGAFQSCRSPLDAGATAGCTPDPMRVGAKATTPPQVNTIGAGKYEWVHKGTIATMSFEPVDGDHMDAEITLELADGSIHRIESTISRDADGNVTFIATHPTTGETYTQVSTMGPEDCWPCHAAWGAAGGLAAAACLSTWWTAVVGAVICVATAVGSGVAASFYCASNPCHDGAPACRLHSATYDNRAYSDTWKIWSNNFVECSKEMNYLRIEARLYKNGQPVWTTGPQECFGDRTCYAAFYYSDFVGGSCYYAVAEFVGYFTDPATSQTTHYGPSSLQSNTVCF